jgi:L-lactate dehydrogenase
MKIGIVGSGMVGATTAYALMMRGIGRELVLIDRNAARAQAEADDILHAVPFANPMEVRAGEYSDLAGSQVVVLTAGTAQKPGETRLQLLERNASILKDIVAQVLRHAPEATLLVATNPVDVMTHLTARYAAQYCSTPGCRVIGSGTTLDTARFRSLLGRHLGVDPQHIHSYVVGEHGDSEVLAWSLVTVGGVPLIDFCRERKVLLDETVKHDIDERVRRAAYSIIQGKGATYYGIGSALASIVKAILRDERTIRTVCSPLDEVAGVKDVTLSLPHLLGDGGVIGTLPLPYDAAEYAQLQASAKIIREAIESVG